jgi:AcrR family transcriptional regulator
MTNQLVEPTERRRSRGERDPRAAIVAAAYRVLAEQGYEATTIKQVARVAGVAPGLVHYYFVSKEQLLGEVLQLCAARARELSNAAGASGRRLTEDGFAAFHHELVGEPNWYRLRYETFALGLRHPELLPTLSAMLREARGKVGELVDADAQVASGEALRQREAVGAILLACFDGLALQKLADPDFDIETADRVLAQMLRSYLADRSQQTGPTEPLATLPRRSER